ncbi:MAG: type II secretion system major pseudopilin GspG [Armatimonadota bacterium]
MLRLRNRSLARGFTLIELLVVIVILGILAAVIIPNVVGKTEDARVAKARADIESLGTALDMYKVENGRFPTTEQGLQALRERPTTPPLPRSWNEPFLKKPLPADPWGQQYLYRSPGEHDLVGYDLYSLGADGREGGSGADADITNWN